MPLKCSKNLVFSHLVSSVPQASSLLVLLFHPCLSAPPRMPAPLSIAITAPFLTSLSFANSLPFTIAPSTPTHCPTTSHTHLSPLSSFDLVPMLTRSRYCRQRLISYVLHSLSLCPIARRFSFHHRPASVSFDDSFTPLCLSFMSCAPCLPGLLVLYITS